MTLNYNEFDEFFSNERFNAHVPKESSALILIMHLLIALLI